MRDEFRISPLIEAYSHQSGNSIPITARNCSGVYGKNFHHVQTVFARHVDDQAHDSKVHRVLLRPEALREISRTKLKFLGAEGATQPLAVAQGD